VRRLQLTYGGELYDRTAALYLGTLQVEGVDLTYLRTHIEDLFWRQAHYAEFDVAEFSLGAYLSTLGSTKRPLVAIPVFPSRAFRHSAVYVKASSSLRDIAELARATIGVPEWSQTATLWVRGIMAEHYAIDLTKITWRTGGLVQPGRVEKSPVLPPPSFSVEPIDPGSTLVGLLAEGELDAIISARSPASAIADGAVRPLYHDPRHAEADYFRCTSIFPIMHVVVLKRDLASAHPWLPNNLYNAFEAARLAVKGPLTDHVRCVTSLAWEAAYAAEEETLLGDAFAYGLEHNYSTLQAVLRYACAQGFCSPDVKPEDLFAETTLTKARI
jgi:4,5-dihydroxyphthalate decarboxylase